MKGIHKEKNKKNQPLLNLVKGSKFNRKPFHKTMFQQN